MLIDSHAHIDLLGDAAEIEAAVGRAVGAGVNRIVTVGDGLESSRRAVELSQTFPRVFTAIGVHPHDADTVTPQLLEDLRRLAAAPKVVAIGETGLDFYRMRSSREAQFQALAGQLKLAAELELALIVHCRDAYPQLLAFMRPRPPDRAVIHCFSGTATEAEEFLKLGFYLSFAGNVTFKNAEPLRQVAAAIPLNRLLIETDCPYLTPHPHRGKPNEPAYLPLIAKAIAEAKRTPVAEVVKRTAVNTDKVFCFSKF